MLVPHSMQTLASHEIVFAAEESRHGNNVSSLEW